MTRSLLAALLLLSVMLVHPVAAQDAAAPSADAATTAPAEAETAPEDSAPPFPAGLDAPDIPVAELELRLIPLTVDELGALAEAWHGVARREAQAVSDLQVEVLRTDGNIPGDLQAQLAEAVERRGAAFDRFTSVVTSFANKGGDQAAVDSYRAYRSSVIIQEQQAADWRTLANQAMRWAIDRDGGIALAIQVSVVVGAFIALVIVARIVRRIALRLFGRVPNLSKLLQAFLAMAVYWLTMAVGLMIVLAALGVNVTPLFALVGGASFIIAFAMQDTLGNLAAGLMIMINRPFDEGDYVTVAGTGGTVKSVSIVSTKVTTPDNQVIVIPNSRVWGDIITNVTASATRRVDLVFGISYEDSIENAQRILEQVVRAHPLVLSDPEPVIRVNALGASSVDFICRPWTRSADYWTVYWDLTRQVKEAFDRSGISIPYPQTDMHLIMKDGATPALPGVAGQGASGVGRPAGAPDFRSGDDGAQDEGGMARD
jgi:small conductance mechanosensitive channel